MKFSLQNISTKSKIFLKNQKIPVFIDEKSANLLKNCNF